MTRNGRVTFMTASKEKCHAKPQARKAKKKAAPPPPPPAQQARNNSNNQTRAQVEPLELKVFKPKSQHFALLQFIHNSPPPRFGTD